MKCNYAKVYNIHSTHSYDYKVCGVFNIIKLSNALVAGALEGSRTNLSTFDTVTKNFIYITNYIINSFSTFISQKIQNSYYYALVRVEEFLLYCNIELGKQ